MSLRFHWMLPWGGETGETPAAAARYRIGSASGATAGALPDVEGWIAFARRAEEAGIDSTLISFGRYAPDPFLVACAVGHATTRLKFIIAYRSGLMQPATFVQQINTLSAMIDGRVAINVVAGSSKKEQRGYGDFLEHDERYARATESRAASCTRRSWRRTAPLPRSTSRGTRSRPGAWR